MNDRDHLQKAVILAQRSAEPVKCACILVQGGQIIAKTYNSQRTDGIATHHAEIKAIAAANRRTGSRKLTGTTAYCSCEPCVMCLSALSIAEVGRIIYHQRMADVAPDDPMSSLDPVQFAAQYLKFAPVIEQLTL